MLSLRSPSLHHALSLSFPGSLASFAFLRAHTTLNPHPAPPVHRGINQGLAPHLRRERIFSDQVPGQGSSLCPIRWGREWGGALTPTWKKKEPPVQRVLRVTVLRDKGVGWADTPIPMDLNDLSSPPGDFSPDRGGGGTAGIISD